MKKYQVAISIAVSAKNESEAKRIMKQIVESGSALGSEGDKIAQIRLYQNPIIVKELNY